MTSTDTKDQPLRRSSLSKERAGASIVSVRSPYDDLVAHGLTPRKLISFIQAASIGDHNPFLSYAAEMEKRDGHYFSVLSTRKLAIVGLPRVVRPVDEKDAREVAIAAELNRYVNSRGFGAAVWNMLDALGKGFSVSELVWDTTRIPWRPTIKYRDPKFFLRDTETASRWLLRSNEHPDGEELERYKYVIHEPPIFAGSPLAGGLARVCAAMHMFKSFGVRDWMAFAEVYGMPIRIGTHPPNASPDDVDTLKRAIRDIGSDAGCVIPANMAIALERATGSGFAASDQFFLALIKFLNSEMSKAVLGQTMTTEDGSSRAQAVVHDNVRVDIRNADAWCAQDTIQRDLIIPMVDLNYGPRPNEEDYPQFTLDTKEPEDLAMLAAALPPFIDRGLPVSVRAILERFQLPGPESDEQLLERQGSGTDTPSQNGNPNGTAEENAQRRLSLVLRAIDRETNMRRLKERLTEIL